MTKGTVLVASPSAIGRSPVARGLRVPPWPALAASKMRRTAATPWVDVMPAGLSSATHPSTFWPRRLALIGIVPAGIFVGVSQIARHRGAAQEALDALGLLE